MQLTRGAVGDAIRRITKYDYTWHSQPSLYPQAMLLTKKTFLIAGPPRFDEEVTALRLSTARTDRFPSDPLLQMALDTFEGRKGGVLCAIDKAGGTQLAELQLSSPPVFDGMAAANGRVYMSLKNGQVVCLSGK
jgi:hypothetical protein